MKAEVRPEDGFRYYSYILIYVDDCLAIHHNAIGVLNELDYYFKMKPGSIGDPDIYLGAKLRVVTLPNGVKAWGLSPSKYVHEAVTNVEKWLEKKGMKLAKKQSAPWPADYHAELDVSELLNDDDAQFYQTQIGVLRWMIEIGRIDVITEVSILSSYLA
jgi:hypothetical protein